MMRKTVIVRYVVCTALLTGALAANGQENERRTSSSIYLKAFEPSDVVIPFSIQAEGRRFTPTWGLDMAWEDANNVRRGMNHMGKENIGIGRTSFRTVVAMPNETTLASDHTSHLRTRANAFNIVSETLPLVMNSDCGAGTHSYYSSNNKANTDHWCQMLNAHVQWMLDNTKHPILGVSPFNEPDYSVKQGTKDDFLNIAKKLKADYPLFKDRIISGGNTLNCDQALPWYTHLSEQLDWGNTHQLAGTFANYAGFFQRLVRDGKVACNDEMHNVGEAMIGLEYGMSVGIWWGFDSRARGEFCDISRNGVRLAYAEHRPNWTAASVYRHDKDGKVKAFIGSSERQAATTSYEFLSTDHPVFYDGYGPYHELRMELPGGQRGSYQKGQTNAERVIDVTWGEDVQPYPIDGVYKIMSKATLGVVAEYGSSGSNTNVSQMQYTGQKAQQWNIHPVDSRIGGDYSFYDITSVNDKKHIDVLNYSLLSGENLIAYPNTTASSNQQWYLEYAGDGFFYIRNRNSALYLTLASGSSANGTNINQQSLNTANPERQLWRIIPTDAECELVPPAKPVGLTATPHSASVELSWTANQETDLDSYTIVRSVRGKNQWNTIARQLRQTQFTDNTCLPGNEYEYRVKAIDRSANQSELSDAVAAMLATEPAMIAHWEFDDDAQDATENLFDMAVYNAPKYQTNHKSGTKAISFTGTQYAQLPYSIASSDELSVTFWISMNSTSLSGQHLIDFGNGPDHYLYLSPNSGQGIRFAIKNGGEEQTIDGSRLWLLTWQHVALTIGREKTAIYLNGKEVASSTGITIKPSDIKPVLNYVGRSQNADDNFLKAGMDDLRIFNYALDAAAVQQVMNDTDTGLADTQSASSWPTCYFTTDGKQHPQMQRGLNIIRYSDGNVRKEIKP